MASLLNAPYTYLSDANGLPLVGGLIYSYDAGTTTPKATYTDSGGGTPLSNPIVLDSAGRAEIWISGAYKFVVKDSLGSTIHTTDNVTAGGLLSDGDYGDVTVSGGGSIISVDADAITNAKLANMAANTVKANATAISDNPTDVALSTNQVLGRLSSNIVAIPIGTSANNLVALDASAKLPAVDGSQLTGIVTIPVTSVTASSSSTIPFTGLDFTTYFYEFELVDLIVSGNNSFTMTFSTNSGGAYATLGAWVAAVCTSIYVPENSSSIVGNTDATIFAGGDSATPANGRVVINQNSSSAQLILRYILNGSILAVTRGFKQGTTRTTTAAAIINAVQFVPSAGSFTSGKIIMRAMKKV